MSRSLHVAVPILALAAGALCGVGSASAAAPGLASLSIYQPPGQPGVLVGVARVSMRGAVTQAGSFNAQGGLRHIGATLRLSAKGRTATDTDTVRLEYDSYQGDTALLYFDFSRAAARRLAGATSIAADLRVGPVGSRRVKVGKVAGGHATAVGHEVLCGVTTCTPIPQRPPTAPVLLRGWSGSTEAAMCVFFHGPGTTKPYVDTLEILPINFTTADWVVWATSEQWPIVNGEYSAAGWKQPPSDDSVSGPVAGSDTRIAGMVSAGVVAGGAGEATATYSGDPVGGIAQSVTVATDGPRTSWARTC